MRIFPSPKNRIMRGPGVPHRVTYVNDFGSKALLYIVKSIHTYT